MKKIALVVLLALTVPAVLAAEPATPSTVRVNVEYVVPMSSTTVEGSKVEADSAIGGEVSYEYRFSKMFGGEIGVGYAKHDIKSGGEKGAEVSITPVFVNGNFHFLEGLDLYVGPTIGYIFTGDLKAKSGFEFNDGQTSISTKSKFVWGVNAGLDIPVGQSVAVTVGLRWLSFKAEADQAAAGPDLKVDPLFVRAGVAFRF